jgi:hypothetical protein
VADSKQGFEQAAAVQLRCYGLSGSPNIGSRVGRSTKSIIVKTFSLSDENSSC